MSEFTIIMTVVFSVLGAAVIAILGAMATQGSERRRWEKFLAEKGLEASIREQQAASHVSLNRDERLDRLEQAIEAMAIEMERVGEGQRFVTKLLTERKEKTPPSPIPGAVRSVPRQPA